MFSEQLNHKFSELESEKKVLMQEINFFNDTLKFKKEFMIDRRRVSSALKYFDKLVDNLSLEEQIKLFETLIEKIEVNFFLTTIKITMTKMF